MEYFHHACCSAKQPQVQWPVSAKYINKTNRKSKTTTAKPKPQQYSIRKNITVKSELQSQNQIHNWGKKPQQHFWRKIKHSSKFGKPKQENQNHNSTFENNKIK